jgi:hypothetical protein
MTQFKAQSIPREQFLMMAINLLYKAFIESARTDAKNVYREIFDGKAIHLSTVQMEDKATVRFNLSLDQTEFRGKLNYGAFRASLATLIDNISQALRNEKEVPVFSAAEDADGMIFGITAVTMERDVPNVMVLAADPGGQGDAIMLRLMYLDPQQFAARQTAGTGDPGASGEQA